MKQNARNSQLEVLNRFSYMLDEYSVQYLASQDTRFRHFIDSLYETVESQANKLLSTK